MLSFRGEGNVAAVRDRICPVPMKRLAGTSDAGVELEVPASNSGGRCVRTGSIGTSGSYARSKNRGDSSELHDDENLASR
jgi:glucose-6-phosphate dehydrogenase assembly protein OpcA